MNRQIALPYGHESRIQSALLKNGKSIELQQRTKAEADLAVAAASILARERFIDWLERTGRSYGQTLPRGVSAGVKKAAAALVAAHSAAILEKVAKTHFRTASEIAPDLYQAAPRKEWKPHFGRGGG